MSAQERLDAFRQALAEASARFGVRLAVVQQMGTVVLDEPALAYVVSDREEPSPEMAVGALTSDIGDPFPAGRLPLSACGEGVGG